MGSYLSAPNTEKETDRFNDDWFRVGSSSMQGWRQNQEDAHTILLGFGAQQNHILQNKLNKLSPDSPDREALEQQAQLLPPEAGLFSVFDGHGGPDVSKYAGTRVQHAYSETPVNEHSPDSSYQQIIMNLDADIRQHFTSLVSQDSDPNPRDSPVQDILEKELNEAKEQGMTREAATKLMMKVLYLKQQNENRSQNLSDKMGCTCVTSLIIPREKNGKRVYTVKATNSGDSRVLVWNAETGQVHGTKDHKPNDPDEKARIEAAGGQVRECNSGGERVQYRVNGNLNLCRALGDFEYKQRADLSPQLQMITSCPDIYSWECQEGDIVVLACDGIFDVLKNEEVIAFVRERIHEKELGLIAEEMMTRCLSDDPKISHGIGGDNMTTVIVHLTGDSKGNFPPNKPSETVEDPSPE